MPLPLVDDVRDRLTTERFGRPLRGFEALDSTNSRAAAWAQEGATEGSTVVAEYQRAGRGRHGRSWTACKGQNLLFSIVLRPTLAADRLSLLTVAASVAVAEALEPLVTPHRPTIKWPNDVLLEGRKTCGMLLESSLSDAPSGTVVVLGVGLNVNQTDFPAPLTETATSLRLTTGRTVPRAPLLARLLQGLEARYDDVEGDRSNGVRARFHDRLATLNETTTLRLTESGQTLTGTVRGITADGALRLETDGGTRVVHAGDTTTQS